mgnify:CR=1 FL=1
MNYISRYTWLFLICYQFLSGQDNYKLENFGNSSILLNGNVTGSIDDLGLTFYNPARLSFVEEKTFTVNADVYEFSSFRLDNFFNEPYKDTQSNFSALPSLVAGTFKIKKLPNHNFAYSIFSRTRQSQDINYGTGIIEQDILSSFAGEELFDARVNSNTSTRDNWIGLTWSTLLSENLSIGASVFYSDYEFSGRNNSRYAILSENEQVGLYNNDISFRQKSRGLLLKIAAAWNVDNVELGVNMDLPYIQVLGDADFRYDEIQSNFGNADDIFTFNNFSGLDSSRRVPLNVSFGAGVKLEKHKLFLNVNWYAKQRLYDVISIPPLVSETGTVPDYQFNEEYKSIVNFGAGANIVVTEKFGLYTSFSTDFSPVVSNATLADLTNGTGEDINIKTDFYHFGLGFDVQTKWISFLLGGVYSRARGDFTNPIDLPLDNLDFASTTRLSIDRLRVVLGFEIQFLDKAKKDLGLDKIIK